MKKNMKKSQGFTLAELLIVVAIIAVLVAISIPVFTTQLAKAELATDTSNARAAYAEAVTQALADGKTDPSTGKLIVSVSHKPANATLSIGTTSIIVSYKSLSNSFAVDDSVSLNWVS